MSRFTRTVSASGGAEDGGHTTHCSYEWELIANCKCWECCYTGSLDIQVAPTSFSAFKVVMNGMQMNCSGQNYMRILPKYQVSADPNAPTYCNYWCCNSYMWMRPGAQNGCNGIMYCNYYCTNGCHPELFSCCGDCIPYKLVGCVMSGNSANTARGFHGEMCSSQGCSNSNKYNLAFMWNCWTKSTGSTGTCWECISIMSVYSSLNFVSPRYNAGQTCGWGAQIPNWQVYGIRCNDTIESTII